MTDIVVTLPINRGGLFHLQDKVEEPSFWRMKQRPKRFDDRDKVFICTEGLVRGFFEVYNIYYEDDPHYEEDYMHWLIEFEPETWTEIKPIKMRGFQGFRYRKFKWEFTE